MSDGKGLRSLQCAKCSLRVACLECSEVAHGVSVQQSDDDAGSWALCYDCAGVLY